MALPSLPALTINSPEQAARQRALAEALIGQAASPAQNVGQGFADIAAALSGSLINQRVGEAETVGRQSAADALAGLGPNADFSSVSAALANPWLSGPQSQVASALLSQNLERSDPMYQLQLQQAQLELERAQAPAQPDYGFTFAPDGTLIRTDTTSGTFDPMGQFAAPEEGPLVNINTGDTNDFYKGLDAEAGKQIPAAIEAGRNAASNNIRLGQLETLLGPSGTAPQGAQGAFVQAAAGMGIPIQGADEVQAAQALINQMVPGQRPPGSGTMSDQDLALFKASLPSIINQPGGNQKIIQTTKAINEYIAEQGRIAEMIANRQVTREEGARMQAAVPNPLSGAASSPNAAAPQAGTIEDGYRFKGGDPSKPENWEKVN